MKVAANVLLCVLFLSVTLQAADKPKPDKPKKSSPAADASKKSAGRTMRTWTDKTGKFKVKAKFVELTDGKVSLETDDGKTVVLAIEKLSTNDQKIARELAKELARELAKDSEENPFQELDENPFQEGAPKSPVVSKAGGEGPMTDADWSRVKTITPDEASGWSVKVDETPVPDKSVMSKPIILDSAADSKSGGEKIPFFESVDGLLFDRGRGQALVVLHDAAPGKPKVNKLQRVDLVSGKARSPFEFPSDMKPSDVDSTGNLIVARTDSMFSGRPDPGIGVWKVGDDGVKHVRSWSPVEPGDFFKAQASLVKFIDADHVVTLSFPTKLTMWQVSKARAEYKMEIGHGGGVGISPGGKYLAASVKNSLFVLDALSGKTLGRIPGETGSVAALSFRPDGRQLAAIALQRLLVWDLEKGELYRDIYFPQPFPNPSIDWIGKGHLLVGGEWAIDLEKRILLWQYQHEAGSGFSRGYGEAAGHFWYSLTSQDRKERGLYHIRLPHEEALKAAASLNPEKFLAIRPGSTVALNVNVQGTPAEKQQVQQDLSTQLQTLGMNVANGSQLALLATTETGKTRDITYRSFAGGGNLTAKVTDQICRLKFVENGKVVWESSSLSDGSPPILNLKEGQSVQDALAPYQKPNLKFYANVKLPQYVVRPGETLAYGASSLTAQGIKSAPARPTKP